MSGQSPNNYTPTPSGGGWIQRAQAGSGHSWDAAIWVYSKILAGTDISAGSITVTTPNSNNWATTMTVFRGADIGNVLAPVWAAGTTINFPAGTSSAANSVALAIAGHAAPQSGGFPSPTGFTKVADGSQGTQSMHQAHWTKQLAGAGSQMQAPSITVSNNQSRALVIELLETAPPVTSKFKAWVGSSWVTAIPKVRVGSSWVEPAVKVWNGSSWVEP